MAFPANIFIEDLALLSLIKLEFPIPGLFSSTKESSKSSSSRYTWCCNVMWCKLNYLKKLVGIWYLHRLDQCICQHVFEHNQRRFYCVEFNYLWYLSKNNSNIYEWHHVSNLVPYIPVSLLFTSSTDPDTLLSPLRVVGWSFQPDISDLFLSSAIRGTLTLGCLDVNFIHISRTASFLWSSKISLSNRWVILWEDGVTVLFIPLLILQIHTCCIPCQRKLYLEPFLSKHLEANIQT